MPKNLEISGWWAIGWDYSDHSYFPDARIQETRIISFPVFGT